MPAAAGQALVHGRVAKHARRQVGVVSHATFLYDELTALENLRLFGELYGVDDVVSRAMDLLEQVGLARLADERVGRMSRGQQQRVTIARALLHDPALLLLDEPDTGLDLAAFSLLEHLVAAGERSVVLTTHNLAAGLRIGTRVAVLSHGTVAHQQGSVSLADAPGLADLLQRLATV
jgi:heme exporter protein A